MSSLPDEIWSRIIEIGTEKKILSCRDVCCISMSCRRFCRLSNDDSIWSILFSLDFPSPKSLSLSTNPSPKSLYKSRFETERALKVAAYRRAVLNIESQIAIYSMNLEKLQLQLVGEKEKMKAVMSELTNLEKVRQASVALNVWQPETIRGRQKQIVEQCVVPVEYRIDALHMELRVCKMQIEIFNKSYEDEKCKLKAGKEGLASLKYHPLHDYQSGRGIDGRNLKRKKRNLKK
ncbi:F-box protein SKIP24 [Magnolia sinica]|uniref:F-box protein SKIP24 n=1 Tax=Magnolia sinica TaxID=86752 RepID=UPI002659CE5C|nr:F-box protein SKIP24 [Magnolia sinica]